MAIMAHLSRMSLDVKQRWWELLGQRIPSMGTAQALAQAMAPSAHHTLDSARVEEHLTAS